MNEFVINVAQDPSTIININNSDGAVSLDIGQNQQNSITIEDDVNNVLLNPSVFYNGINIVYLSGVSGELFHNTFGDLQGGSANQYYHLSSGQYFNLTTGSVIRPSETGAFYPRSNPSGYITGVDLSGYVTGDVVRPSQTGAFYPTTNPSGYITGVDLSSYATIGFVTGISGYLQPQITNLNNQTGSYVTGNVVRPSETGVFVTQSQTGQFYAASNPSGFITGVDLSGYVTGAVVRPSETGVFITQSQTGQFYPISNPSGFITGINNIVYTTGNQDISGLKDFQTRPTVVDIPVLLSGDAVDLIHLYGKNDQGTTIYKGQPVYINGTNGANPLIQLASNTGERTSSKTIGLLYQDLPVNQFGYIITEGLLEGFNTSAGAAGDPMWLGPSGSIIYGTGNKPYGNNHLVSLGIVLRSNNNNGKVYVKPQNGFEIEELHKVYAINPSNKDTLLYNSASGAWFARQINTGDVSGISDYYLNSNPSGFITGIADSSVTSAKLANSISIGTLGVTGNLTVDTDTLFVDAANNRVGVRTITPAQPLHVVSSTNNSFDGIRVNPLNNSVTFALGWNGIETNNALRIRTTAAQSIQLETNSLNRMTIDSSGNVGINAAPSARLHTISTTEQLRVGYDASNYLSTTVSSSGAVTLNAVGTSPGVVFNNTSITAPNLTPSASNSLMTRSSTEEFLLWTPNIMQYFPVAGSTTNGGSVSNTVGQSIQIGLGTQSSGTARSTLVNDWQFSNAAGGSMRYDRPFKVRIPMNCNMNYSDATGQASCRVYVGSNGSFALPFAGQEPYPTGTRGVGVEWRKASGSFQQEFRLFARDGSSSTTGRFIATNYTGIGANSNSNSKFYDLLLTFNTDTPTNPILNLYASPWLGSTDTVPSRQSSTPVLTLSGSGVPTGSANVAVNWGRIEAAVVGDSGAIPPQANTTLNYFRTIYLQQA